MKVSPNYDSNDWQQLTLPLDTTTPDWNKAIAIFKDRIEGRFFNQIEKIEDNIFSGFSIMALDCLLIETLNQFWLGIEDTNNLPSYTRPRGGNWMSFRDFFNRSSAFNTIFTDDISKVFYNDIRCGLLHQAETKGGSLINFKKPTMITLIDPRDVTKGIEVNRKIFHSALKSEFKNYISLLEDPTQTIVRSNFIKKMKLICR